MQASVLHVSRDRRRQQLQSILPSLRFALRLARLQLGGGRHFVFEHPPNSSIWRLPGVRALLADPRCRSLTVDLGKFGSTSQGGTRKHYPPTRLVTSSQAVVSNLLGFRAGMSKDRAEPNNLGYPKAFADKLVQAFEQEFDYETARLFNKGRAHECYEIVGSHGGLDFVHEALAGEDEPAELSESDEELGEPFSGEVPASIRSALRRVHEATGHRPPMRLARALLLSGAPPSAVQAARELRCAKEPENRYSAGPEVGR